MKETTRKRVRFDIKAEPGSKVFVTGSFNNWDAAKNKMKENNGTFSTSILLPQGRHEYKFVINGVWCVDPNCPDWVANGFGSLNSVVVVE
jgi:1,4-alpha-glucan branching enzyme